MTPSEEQTTGGHAGRHPDLAAWNRRLLMVQMLTGTKTGRRPVDDQDWAHTADVGPGAGPVLVVGYDQASAGAAALRVTVDLDEDHPRSSTIHRNPTPDDDPASFGTLASFRAPPQAGEHEIVAKQMTPGRSR
jgi:hypothetical protein